MLPNDLKTLALPLVGSGTAGFSVELSCRALRTALTIMALQDTEVSADYCPREGKIIRVVANDASKAQIVKDCLFDIT